MSAKDEILSRIRSALADTPATEEVPREYRTTSEMNEEQLIELLVDRLVDYKAGVEVIEAAQIPEFVAAKLKDASSVVYPQGLDTAWLSALGQNVEQRIDAPGARLSVAELDATSAVVTSSAVSVAESGTIILDGQPDQGRRAISLVPDHHVCIVPISTIVQLLPEAMPRLSITRPLTWISGPSATSDIELERVEGVHGPRTLDVLMVRGL
ncbi:lactate utilization protein C [Glutamicibacter mishrai]|uniref:Lactate utilization protein C n=1 Tax=Glutamicibacter mishrai TaxID=1775880 RepID=A0A6H0SG35_9MICC|nr:lactate utilization protein C [Glutamicibacter mishrai]QIV86612.1 lactate utilization protein C [Glutamicibacter mishrai]UTT39196.1 lactate utilization protein C [Glutamicibacter mishrai]